MMRIGIFLPGDTALSMRRYTENIIDNLIEANTKVVTFGKTDKIPQNVDLYWDPRVGGGNAPYRGLKSVSKPLVMTLHGARFRTEFALQERWAGIKRPVLELLVLYKLFRWRQFGNRIQAIITVSKYSADLIPHALPIPKEKIYTIYHGVDHELFVPCETPHSPEDAYFLHVSAGFRRGKNVERIVEAYNRITIPDKPKLRLVLAGYNGNLPFETENLEIIRRPLSHEELALHYQHAIGFIYPSLSETFGMPILEAMASGCPVITANDTACGEVAGDAALLVNPRSVEEIQAAMTRFVEDGNQWFVYREKGLEHAAQFSWQISASEHLALFEKILT